jgi:lysozyme family protein
MTLKTDLINAVIDIEGGYVNDPDDSGGETNYGITSTAAKEHGYTGSIGAMPLSVAVDIYEEMYWHAIHGDSIVEMSQIVAAEVFDTAVNTGVHRASIFLQRALNVLNDRERLYPDIKTDGAIGPNTINALRCYVRRRDAAVMVTVLNAMQGAFYVELAEQREKDEKFLYGWIKNRVEVTND